MALIDLSLKFDEIKKQVESVPFSDVQLSDMFKYEYEKYLSERNPNGYVSVEWADFSTKIITSSDKIIYIANFWFYVASELAYYLDSLKEQRDIFSKIYDGENLQNKAKELREKISELDKNKIKRYFSDNNYSEHDCNLFLKFVTDYKSWGGGKTIDRNDYYVSPLLQAGNLLAETQSAIAEIAKQFSETPILQKSFNPTFIKKLSVIDSPILIDNNEVVFLSKPFLLLAGISGTGKTRFVREQAKALGSINETYQLVAVRPDWHEPSDLLGYISRLGGSTEYVTTDVIKFIAKAWRAILDSGLELSVKNLNGQGDRLVVVGEKAQLDSVLPYWLCLDEMNLAPVEQYFADYLSILETREWHWQENDFQYCCDAILNSTTIEQLSDKEQFRNELGFADPKYNLSWNLFVKHGFSIPFNLIVAGTVNMDETTHGFSRKVIDRALSFDFGKFFPNDFDHFSAPVTKPVTLTYPIWSDARQHLSELPSVDNDGTNSIEFLKSVNAILKNTPFELAFRALNELLLAVISTQPKDDIELYAVWDDFLMCKVLPRIEGDTDKLGNDPSLLEDLTELLKVQFADFWNKQDGEDDARPDLYQEKITGDDKMVRIKCRSKAKLEWMQKRLNDSSFTSFWP